MSFQFSLNNLRFEDIRAEIITFLKNNSQYSATFDWTASNMSFIIDTMTYVTMLMSYQLTTVANNNFLDTTNIRKNAVSIAKSMGYRPKRMQSAVINTILKYYDPNTNFTADSSITIAAKSTFISSSGKTFINLLPVTLTASDTNRNLLIGNLSLIEGSFKNYTYLGTGENFQTFSIPSTKVEENNIELHVHLAADGDTVENKWTEVKNPFNVIGDKIFFVEEDIANEGYPKLVFGDGIVGLAPSNEEIININYLESNGAGGNGDYLVSLPSDVAAYSFSPDLTTQFTTFEFAISNFIEYSNTEIVSYGGTDLETLDEIKLTAPKSFAAAGRAVTRNDFITLLDTYAYIFQGNAIGGEELFPGEADKLGNVYLTGIPFFDYAEFLNTHPIYLTDVQEGQLRLEISKYNVISTKINFYKPSYIYVDLFPSVEFKNDVSVYDETIIKNTVNSNLAEYFDTNFTKFNAIYRESKIQSEINKIPEVISSDIQAFYYFILNYDSLYEANNSANNFIYLPVQIKAYDIYGNISEYENFVQTNLEYAVVENLVANPLDFDPATTVPLEERTIYGKLYHPNVDRYMYNEDIVQIVDAAPVVEECLLKIFGENVFFNLYRYDANLASSQRTDIKVFNNQIESQASTLEVTQEVLTPGDGYSYDNYALSIYGNQFGHIIRNQNRDFNLGPVTAITDISAAPSAGVFQEIYADFSVSGTNYNFASVSAGDVIIYNASGSGMWEKCPLATNISAATDEALFTARTQDEMYSIVVSGDFGGELPTPAVSGDTIIFNLTSSANPTYKWEILNYRTWEPNISIEASGNLPTAAVPYDVRLITNVTVATNFGGRSIYAFAENDLIFFTNTATADTEQWVKLVNVASSAEMLALDPVSATVPGILDTYDYVTPGVVPLGKVLRVVDVGIFQDSSEHIYWPSTEQINQIAYVDDLLVYVGNEMWVIFSQAYSNLFSLDGSIDTNLPLELTYADYFTVSGSGNFNNMLTEDFVDGESVVYTGDNTWKKRTSIASLDASSASGAPADAVLGDILHIIEAGSFSDSLLVAPSGQDFVQGDYIIFNGTNWVPMREYSFVYDVIPPSTNGADYLNNTLGFNSVFYYTYNPTDKYYSFKFNDIYHGSLLGKFTYNSLSKYETGRLLFEETIVGNYDYQTVLDSVVMKRIFDNYDNTTKMDKIKITPKGKTLDDIILREGVTDFDTTFNQFIIVNVNEITRI